MSRLDEIYKKSPALFQKAMVAVYGYYWHQMRFGGNYHYFEDDFRKREGFSPEDWSNFREKRLISLLSICQEQVPYYRGHWSSQEKKAAKIGKLCDIPLLEKSPIREDPAAFCRQDMNPFPRFRFHTSGTTGTPIVSHFTLNELRASMALRETRSANWAGVSFRDPRGTFSGRIVEPDPISKGPFYRYNPVEKQVYLSAFHLKPENADQYVQALIKHDVKWLTGYAVSFYLLAKYILEQQIKPPRLSAIITTSEKLTIAMRKVMQLAYQCPIFEEYSTVESALFASECQCGRLHVSPDAGIVEILKPDGTPSEPGEVGEVVATCLFRSFQPLIRFRLGDLAAWDSDPCPCGRQMPVIREVIGRIEDIVTGPDGRQLVRFHGIFVDQPHIIEGQIIQKTLVQIIAKVVPTTGFNSKDIIEIQNRIHQRLGDRVQVSVELVDSIPRTTAGKFKAVISEIKTD